VNSRHHEIERLGEGAIVQFRPRGHSMSGRIEDNQLVTVAPLTNNVLDVGDIILCRVNGRVLLHLIKAIDGHRYQIGNNRGHINGWTVIGKIYGKCVSIE